MSAQTHAPGKPGGFGLNFLNTRIATRVSALHGEAAVFVAEHWMPFGEAPPLHRHPGEDEIFYIISGRYRFRVGDREIVATAGDTVLAPRGIAHTFRVESEDGGHCLVSTSSPAFEGFIEDLSTRATSDRLPHPVEPTPDQQRAMIEAGQRHGIEIVGPPMPAPLRA